jgi:hypothetical protein
VEEGNVHSKKMNRKIGSERKWEAKISEQMRQEVEQERLDSE